MGEWVEGISVGTVLGRYPVPLAYTVTVRVGLGQLSVTNRGSTPGAAV